MNILEILSADFEKELDTTRKMLSKVPENNYAWKPHAKSMNMIALASHIAELPSWIPMTFNTSELDFAKNPYKLPEINTTAELLKFLEDNIEGARRSFAGAKVDQLWDTWTLRNGEEIYSQSSKYDVMRMVLSQIIHHRAQLGVYLRLLNIPIPGSYGPSADEMEFATAENQL